MTLSERSSEILGKFVFLNKFEKGQARGKFGLDVNNPFCTKQLNGANINENCFTPQNEPNTIKLCFYIVL